MFCCCPKYILKTCIVCITQKLISWNSVEGKRSLVFNLFSMLSKKCKKLDLKRSDFFLWGNGMILFSVKCYKLQIHQERNMGVYRRQRMILHYRDYFRILSRQSINLNHVHSFLSCIFEQMFRSKSTIQII